LASVKHKLSSNQVLVECSANFDNDEQLSKILGVDTSVNLSQIEPLMGEASVSGVITINVIYLTESEQVGSDVYSTNFVSKINDAQITSSDSSYINTDNIATERYIDSYKGFDDIYYQKGKFAKYKEVNGTLYFNRNYPKVMVVYHGIEVDEDGLPLINEKEMRAIAAYVAYATLYKEGLTKRDGGLIQLASTVQAD
jgi:hypothetical protein